MRRTRKRLIEVIKTLNPTTVPDDTIDLLERFAFILGWLHNPPSVGWVGKLGKVINDPKTSWYIKDLCQDVLWHLDHAPWSGPNAP